MELRLWGSDYDLVLYILIYPAPSWYVHSWMLSDHFPVGLMDESLRSYGTYSSTLQFLQHIKPQTIGMSDANSQDLFTTMTVISANIEGLTASKAFMLSEICKRENCHR